MRPFSKLFLVILLLNYIQNLGMPGGLQVDAVTYSWLEMVRAGWESSD